MLICLAYKSFGLSSGLMVPYVVSKKPFVPPSCLLTFLAKY